MMTEQEWLTKFSHELQNKIYNSGLAKKDVSILSGIHKSDLSKYLSGDRKPTIRALVNLSYVLDCPIEELIDFGDQVY